MKSVVSVDIGGTTIKFAVMSLEGKMIEKWSVPTNCSNNGNQIIPTIIQEIKQKFAQKTFQQYELIGVGIGTPGQVDFEDGTVIGAYNLGWAKTQHIKALIEEALNVSVAVDNDANVAALGEQWFGAGLKAKDVVMITLGTGVGGGVIINHQIIRGRNGIAGEIGHIQIEKDGFSCTCGLAGCLETVASATGIVNLAKRQVASFKGESVLLSSIDSDKCDAKQIFDAAKENDALAKAIVLEFSRFLGQACVTIAHLLNPDYIIVGGGVSHAGHFLLDAVNHYYKQHSLPQVANSSQLTLATLGNDAGIYGATKLILEFIKSKQN